MHSLMDSILGAMGCDWFFFFEGGEGHGGWVCLLVFGLGYSNSVFYDEKKMKEKKCLHCVCSLSYGIGSFSKAFSV